MPLECPLCASRRPFLRIERFKNADGDIGVRAYHDTGGASAWKANGFEAIWKANGWFESPSPNAGEGIQIVEAYTVCRNGHVALDDPRVGAAHKVCTLGSDQAHQHCRHAQQPLEHFTTPQDSCIGDIAILFFPRTFTMTSYSL